MKGRKTLINIGKINKVAHNISLVCLFIEGFAYGVGERSLLMLFLKKASIISVLIVAGVVLVSTLIMALVPINRVPT